MPTRLLAFVLGGAVALLGGALFAINAGYVPPDMLGFGRAGDSLIAALIGGFGVLIGSIIGTFFFVHRTRDHRRDRRGAQGDTFEWHRAVCWSNNT